MRVRVDRFFDFFFQRTSIFEEYDILRKLPSGIRRKVVMHINKKLVQKFWKFFGNVKNELRCALLMALKVRRQEKKRRKKQRKRFFVVLFF